MSEIEKVRDSKRFDYIINVLFNNGFGFFIEKLRLKDRLILHQRLQKESFKEKEVKPYMVRQVFDDLGGIFRKLAQFLSMRPDLIPIEYVKDFEKVRDVPSTIPSEEIEKIIEREFGKSSKEIFKEFGKEPIESYTITQTYKTKLQNGEGVRVKIQRPNIKEIIKRDTDLILSFVNHIEEQDYKIRNINPRLIINEFKKWIENELDFEKEIENIRVFSNNSIKDKDIIIPKVYEEYSTKKILTTEFIDGTKLNNIELEQDINYITKISFNRILKQIFVNGFFHANPKNIMIIDDDKISFSDFSMVGIFDGNMRENAANLLGGIIKSDSDKIINSLDIGAEEDTRPLKVEIENKIKPLQGLEQKDIIISEVLGDILNLVNKYGFKLQIDFVLFEKTIMEIEKIALVYNPEFKITVQNENTIKRIIKKKKSTKHIIKNTTTILKDFTTKFPEKTSDILKRIKETNIDLRYVHRDIKNLIMELDRSSTRVTFGLIIAALIIASTLMLQYDEIKIMNISAFSFISYLISAILIIVVVTSMLREKVI